MDLYYQKYLKYKNKYLQLRNLALIQNGGYNCLEYGFQQHAGECWHDALGMIMMQSDLTSEEFIKNIKEINVDTKHQELTTMFTGVNLDKNAYLLPFQFYVYYLENKDKPGNKIKEIINNFLRLSKEYISNHKKRVENRLTYDAQMKRYKVAPTKESIARISSDADTFLQQMMFYKSMNPQMLIPSKEEYMKQAIKQKREEYKKDSESTPRGTRLKRAESTASSLVCSTTIIQILNLILESDKKRQDYKTNRGGTIDHESLAYEILLLYLMNNDVKTKYYLSRDTFICDRDSIDKLKVNNILQKLNSDKLIGINISVSVDKPGDHAISLYKCGDEYKLYDDNIPDGVVKVNWKKSIEDELLNILNDRPTNIAYPYNKIVLEQYGLQKLNPEQLTNVLKLNEKKIKSFAITQALSMIDMIKTNLKITEIPEFVQNENLDENIRQIENIYAILFGTIYRTNPSQIAQLMPPPIIGNIIRESSKIQFRPIHSLHFVTKNKYIYDEYECEYILNKFKFGLENEFMILFERLLKIKNITKDNCKEELLKILQKYYGIIDFNYMYYIITYFNKDETNNVISFEDENLLVYKLIQTVPDIINNLSFVNYFIPYRISSNSVLTLYYMNTDKSEKILDKIDAEYMNKTIEEIERLLKYNEETEAYLREYNIIKNFYNPETKKYEDLTIKEIIRKYPTSEIRNITGSSNKARIMALMQQK
jgi:hypothetical protein